MKTFIVNSDVPQEKMDALVWLTAVPQILRDERIDNIKFVTAYCCTPERRVIVEFEAPDKQTISSALSKIHMPFTVISEATKIV